MGLRGLCTAVLLSWLGAVAAPAQSLWTGREAYVDARLAELQTSESDWHARRARVILQHRATQRAIDRGARRTLEQLFGGRENVDLRLRGMWALHVTGLLTGDRLMQALDDPEPYVRAWAVRLLTEDLAPGREAVARFARMARQDDSPVVRKYLAAALQRVGDRWSLLLVEALLGGPR